MNRFEDKYGKKFSGYKDSITVLSLVATVGVNSLAQAFLHDQVVAFQAGRQEEAVPDDDGNATNVDDYGCCCSTNTQSRRLRAPLFE